MPAPRDYNTISPSAKGLLFLKSVTKIPYALEAATLVHAPEPFTPDFEVKHPYFWGRVMHFEDRYWSINQLLEDLPIHNILELSSGFSFRGLKTAENSEYFYIDTDLPDLISTKQALLEQLHPGPLAGHLEVLPLNALDEIAFEAIVAKFPPGPLVIVNEGLLMYLDPEEKKQLCQIIHRILQKRGGYWITADIYTRDEPAFTAKLYSRPDDPLMAFLKAHNIEEKKFETFESAKEFFTEMGFEIDKEAEKDSSRLSSLPYFLKSLTPEQMEKVKSRKKSRATWRLKPIG
ncbi:leucine carboxyl methyltransferase [Chitinophaga dinghuensis]|uniref:Leucine carboxyl methyltransferase n=1 Tax=Chitinophaga dinghuensis TaxID=1539050 RepID=A0A327VWB9_9BACT|nr:class I SAM-dependent methyltransferase [Chitinophaga dinghuensis]RAJ79134.1 leucine carboxyl methyltransferase [Chitinophaga dinghuensis]